FAAILSCRQPECLHSCDRRRFPLAQPELPPPPPKFVAHAVSPTMGSLISEIPSSDLFDPTRSVAILVVARAHQEDSPSLGTGLLRTVRHAQTVPALRSRQGHAG